MRKSLVALFLLLPISLSAFSGHAACVMGDDEEYAVLAAVLFPNEPDIPDRMKTDIERRAYLSTVTVRLTGFHGESYTLQDKTVPTKIAKTSEASDATKEEVQACKIERAQLLRHVPKGHRITFVSAEEIRNGLSPSSGIAFLSRPVFSANRTESVVDADFRADYEMGVGYRIYLQKSQKTGKWFIAGADRTRMY